MEKDKITATEPKQPKKWLALITYAVVVVCLLLGLLLPLSNVEGFNVDNMLIMQLPGALGSLLGMPELAVGSPFTYGYPFNFMGLLEAPFDLGSLFIVLYALVTLAALIGLIPVIVSKKTSKMALKTASVIEVCALVVLSVLMFMQLVYFCSGLIQFSYAILVAFGGTLICLVVQAFADKKGSGAIKFVSMILSGIAVFFIIYPITALIPQTAGVDFLASGLYSVSGAHEGIDFAGPGGGIMSLTKLFFTEFPLVGSAAAQTITVITLVVALLVLINFVLDVMGLGKKTNAFMLSSNLIRFALEAAAVIIMFVLTFFIEGASAGILLYVLLGIAIVQLVISIVRYVMLAKARKAANPPKAKQPRAAKVVVGGDVVSSHEQKRAERRAQREAELAARAAKEAEEANKPETVEEAPVQEPLYDGPVDEFIKKLNNFERKEFYSVFLERSRGNLTNIPDYIVGGNNNKFFSTVFIYYGRVRALVSDGLLNKLYEQAHVMD